MEKQAKINRMPTPLVNQHSITSTALKVERQMVHDFFSSLFSCGAHSARNGQGHTSELRVPGCAACSGMWVFIYGCVFCAFGLGLWQMLDADGWCLLMVLYMVLSETGIWHRDSKSAGKDALLLHTFTGTSLACYKLVCFWWLCMLSFLSLFVFGKERGISSKKMTKARKDFIHKSRQRKNATEDESNLPHMLASRWKQPATHACKLVFTNTRQAAGDNERQQENEESGQQKTDEYCSRNRWMEIAIEQLRTLD